MKSNKILATALTCMCAITGGVMVGCSSSKSMKYQFKSNQELYAFTSVSAIELALNCASAAENAVMYLEGDDFENMVDTIHSYFPTFENFLGNRQLVSVKEEVLNNAQYLNKLTTNYIDVIGNNHNYEIYYNENQNSSNSEDREVVANITGQIFMNDVLYTFEGVKEIEHDETEIEIAINLAPSNSIIINQELANDEQEFVYTYFEKGIEVYSISFGFEIENGRVKYSTEYENEAEGIEIELEFSQSNKNQNLFYIKYEENDKEVKIKVEKTIQEGYAYYTYASKNQIVGRSVV